MCRPTAWLFSQGSTSLHSKFTCTGSSPSNLGTKKLKIVGYSIMKTSSLCVPSFWHNTGVWRTDRQTDRRTEGFAVAYTALCKVSCKNQTQRIITFNLPSSKPWMSKFGWRKCRLAGIAWSCIAIRTLAKAARPDAASECPMFDLVEPISSGVDRPLLQKTSVTLFASWVSPAIVPVPWSSTYGTVAGSTPTSWYSSWYNFLCMSPDGKARPSNRVQLAFTPSNPSKSRRLLISAQGKEFRIHLKCCAAVVEYQEWNLAMYRSNKIAFR